MIDERRGLVLVGDCRERLRELPAESVQCVVTSPPYWQLRDYGAEGQLGLEPTPQAFVAALVDVFREVRRVLRRDGTCWVNMGDTYTGARCGSLGGSSLTSQTAQIASRKARHALALRDGSNRKRAGAVPDKSLVGTPWRFALAMQDDGWVLRSDIIWHKPNPMPESVRDRPTRAHEYVFLFSRGQRYYYDAAVIAEPLLHPADSTAEDAARVLAPSSHGADAEAGTGRPRRAHADNEERAVGVVHPDDAVGSRALRRVPARARSAVHRCGHASRRRRAGSVRGYGDDAGDRDHARSRRGRLRDQRGVLAHHRAPSARDAADAAGRAQQLPSTASDPIAIAHDRSVPGRARTSGRRLRRPLGSMT